MVSELTAVCDLVLEDGQYLTGYRLSSSEDQVNGKAIVHQLTLKLWHRLPVAGAILRNMWAKSHGARLYPPPG